MAAISSLLVTRPDHGLWSDSVQNTPLRRKSDDHTTLRNDEKLEAAVNRALAAALLMDVRAGIRVMVDEGVPPSIATRVLLTPRHRRTSDWRH